VEAPDNLPLIFHGATLPFSIPPNRESKESVRYGC
jgi:hypothetical protein